MMTENDMSDNSQGDKEGTSRDAGVEAYVYFLCYLAA